MYHICVFPAFSLLMPAKLMQTYMYVCLYINISFSGLHIEILSAFSCPISDFIGYLDGWGGVEI